MSTSTNRDRSDAATFSVGVRTFHKDSLHHLSGVSKVSTYDPVNNKWFKDLELPAVEVVCNGTLQPSSAASSHDRSLQLAQTPVQSDSQLQSLSPPISEAVLVKPKIIKARYYPQGTWDTITGLAGNQVIHPHAMTLPDGLLEEDPSQTFRADFILDPDVDDEPRFASPFVETIDEWDEEGLPVYERKPLHSIARKFGTTPVQDGVVKSAYGQWERLFAGVRVGPPPSDEYSRVESRGPMVLSDYVPAGTFAKMPHLLM